MTAVGKILVFLNLLLSLVVGGFVAFAYVARTHWVAEFGKLEAQNKVLAADARTYQGELEKAKLDANAQIDKIKADLTSSQKDLDSASRVVAQLREELSKVNSQKNHQTALSTIYTSEVNKRQDDVGQLRDTLRKEREAGNLLAKQNAELRDQATVAQIERRSVQDRNDRLEKQVQQMARDMARMRANGGATLAARAGGKNPPPDNVEGLVKETDSKGGNVLMTLDIGSDAGLTKGHTLELFRLNLSAPTQSKYLGTVRILEAEAHQSVAQPVGRLSSPPQRGDRVTSRILGG